MSFQVKKEGENMTDWTSNSTLDNTVSDSAKDFNPLYYLVNRPESTVFHSAGYLFNKKLPLP